MHDLEQHSEPKYNHECVGRTVVNESQTLYFLHCIWDSQRRIAFSSNSWRRLVWLVFILGVSEVCLVFSDSYFQPITSFVSLPLLSNAIVVGLIFLSYAGNRVTCCLSEWFELWKCKAEKYKKHLLWWRSTIYMKLWMFNVNHTILNIQCISNIISNQS